jgi:hypothetical protein
MADPFDLERLRVNLADFQRVVSPAKAKQGRRLMGAPWAFWVDVSRLTEGRAALVVAVLIYRRTRVCNSATVTLPGAELTELGVDRSQKRKALARLQAADLIRIEKAAGRSVRVTLLWRAG